MGLNREEATALIAEQEAQIVELRAELVDRPEKIVHDVHEIVIENSSQSESLANLGLALSKCQSEFKAVGKNADGHKYKYANLTAILEYAQPIYTKYNLSIIQLGVSKAVGRITLTGVKTIIVHESGEWISSEMYQPAVKTKMNSLTQNIGIINSYFRRYMIQSVLCLSTEDIDGAIK